MFNCFLCLDTIAIHQCKKKKNRKMQSGVEMKLETLTEGKHDPEQNRGRDTTA